MDIDDVKNFEQLEEYLRTFSGGERGHYDFVGTFMLFDALLDNLAHNHLDADLDSLAETYKLNAKQTEFLKKIIQHLSGNTGGNA